MQGFQAAVAVFCTVCICAELIAQITGEGWTRRGIKAVAGLYILAVALRTFPQIKTEARAFSVPAASPAALGTLADAVLQQTSAALERQAQAHCQEKLGIQVVFHVALEATEGVVKVRAVTGTLPENWTPELRQALDAAVEEVLSVKPEWGLPGGEALP